MSFFQGEFMRSEKVELKENYTKQNQFFYLKDHTYRLKENTLLTKKCSH